MTQLEHFPVVVVTVTLAVDDNHPLSVTLTWYTSVPTMLFVMGDYSYKPPDGDEQIIRWDFEFTQVELDRNWNMLVKHGRKVGLIPSW